MGSALSQAYLAGAYMLDPKLSYSLLQNAFRVVEERAMSVKDAGENRDNGPYHHQQLPVIQLLAYHPTIPILALSTSLSTVHLYDLTSEEFAPIFFSPDPIGVPQFFPEITALTFSKDGCLAVGLATGIVDIWTIDLTHPRQPAPTTEMLFNPPHLSTDNVKANPAGSLHASPRTPHRLNHGLSSLTSSGTSVSIFQLLHAAVHTQDRNEITKLVTCESISLISDSPTLAQDFTAQEILGYITCLSFSPSGHHIAVGTEKAGLWNYNLIWKSLLHMFPGQLRVTCLCWGPPLAPPTLKVVSGGNGVYRSPPDVTHIVAGLAGGGAAYFRAKETGISLKLLGGELYATAEPIDDPTPTIRQRQYIPDISNIILAPSFYGEYQPGVLISQSESLEDQDPMIVLSRTGVKELQICQVVAYSPAESQIPRLKVVLRNNDILEVLMKLILTYPMILIHHLLNHISYFNLVEFRAVKVGKISVSHVRHPDPPEIIITPPHSPQLLSQSYPNQDIKAMGRAFENENTPTQKAHRATNVTDGRTTREKTTICSRYPPSGYGGEVKSIVMDREGRRLIARFMNEAGKTSIVVFDSRLLYHLSRVDPAFATLSFEARQNGGEVLPNPSLRTFGEKLLRPIGVLVPKSAKEAVSTAGMGLARGKNITFILRNKGSAAVRREFKGTLIEPYVDEIVRRMNREEDQQVKRQGAKAKGKLKAVRGTEFPEHDRLDTRIGEIGIAPWKQGGIIGMVLSDDDAGEEYCDNMNDGLEKMPDCVGGSAVGFVWGVWNRCGVQSG